MDGSDLDWEYLVLVMSLDNRKCLLLSTNDFEDRDDKSCYCAMKMLRAPFLKIFSVIDI